MSNMETREENWKYHEELTNTVHSFNFHCFHVIYYLYHNKLISLTILSPIIKFELQEQASLNRLNCWDNITLYLSNIS